MFPDADPLLQTPSSQRKFDSLVALNAAVGLTNRMLALPEPYRSRMIKNTLDDGDPVTASVLRCFLDILAADLHVIDSPDRQTDHVKSFLLESCEIVYQGGGVAARALYEAYCRWCEANSLPRLSETSFGKTASALCPREATNRGRVYSALKLKG